MFNENEGGKIKLLIAQEGDVCSSVAEFFRTQNGFIVQGVCSSGLEAINLIASKQFDAILLDLVLQDKDGFSVLDFVQNKLKSESKPKILVWSSLSQEGFVTKTAKLGASYFMTKPADFAEIKERIEQIVNEQNIIVSTPKNTAIKLLDERLSTIFITVGIPAHIKGYQYLREAIKQVIEMPNLINNVTKGLYPSVANRFETSASKVERAIRHAIEVAWNRGKISNLNSLFGIKVYSTNEKPTNSEFIALISDKLLLEIA